LDNPGSLPNPNNPQTAAPAPSAQQLPGSTAPPTALAQTAPLPATPVLSAVLAQRLSQAISGSGVFYESHLAESLSGKRSLTELRTEPQARQLSAPNEMLPARSAPATSSEPSSGNTSQTQTHAPASAHATHTSTMPTEI